MEKEIKIALAGNPNSGKTTLFNALTGSNQFVGNWPGVTVEKKEGKLRRAEISTIWQPSCRESSATSIRSPFLRTMSIMLMAMTTGMPSSVSWVVR